VRSGSVKRQCEEQLGARWSLGSCRRSSRGGQQPPSQRIIHQPNATQPTNLQEPEKKKPLVVKYGLNHITQLIEAGKAQMVVIAHDVDPIELVVWLPALCKSRTTSTPSSSWCGCPRCARR